ncbi:hypothetical protein BU24DRAFT_369885 [Aaosphaeria arxii CBS 175.79]|uniref:T6SS Phospholipase effector Tle1-like catalytic domain-containing protein n=1 Tax=Aaosphaeria arxii CBS 175.79 TaxID=1450172 RepID=A0A6A5XRM5_9PLEO|nr:uncharacterized protein BU24DRAFT_369885 [Aaosphaeria arxii CBS 175.79]KAF2015955.1 hypothetical protein BU24DRAFT_369885 [Aaosphaeria arxii CBS 175.79]
MDTVHEQPYRPRRKFVLCFDGTGNKFSGTDADSNILKIYRMLDRNDDSQFHYYQPGIGTYVVAKSLSHTSRLDKIKSWYAKAKDSAIGTSFDAHVMGGYRFLMRYYLPGDDIYFFGFSRGAYTARFLAEMLDHVGLLSAGNEEMCHFAWKTFQKWQCRQERNAKEKKEKRRLLEFMCAFRETFSRPVRPIRFLGLFDTVNSVPRFENAWMQRSKFPYTARSSARVIRHAVSIDERRAKFRQDLISQEKPDRRSRYYRRRHRHHHLNAIGHHNSANGEGDVPRGRKLSQPSGRRDTLSVPHVYRDPSETAGVRYRSPGLSERTGVTSASNSVSNLSFDALRLYEDSDSDTEEQDIQEVWFAGCHADIGGGWPLAPGEDAALSHVPLVWIIREAERAGLNFDEDKLRALNCYLEELDPGFDQDQRRPTIPAVPIIEIDPASPRPVTDRDVSPLGHNYADPDTGINREGKSEVNGSGQDRITDERTFTSNYHIHLNKAATCGRIHDVLCFDNGVTHASVISWNIMEYLPFRRMDLQPDGSWTSITWPLPKGEVRDIPDNAVIHSSVLRRMEADDNYRPGNLIVGGGGRGVRKAPKEMGMGKWKVYREEGDPVGECFVRKEKPRIVQRETASGKPLTVAPNGPQGMFLAGR